VKASQPRKIDAYLRVSRVGERAGSDSYGSPDDQRQAIERWATYQDVQIAKEWLDEDESGGTQERPSLERAIVRALAGKTDGIVCYDISRFSRFTEGGLRDLRRLKESGARLVFTQEQIDTSTWQGRLTYTLLLAMHEAALEQHKERWRTTKARGIREGRQIGPTPVGYERSRGKHGQLVPHPTEGPAITRAYMLAATEGLAAAAASLTEAIPTKTFVARKRVTAERYGVELGDTVTVPATWNLTTTRRMLAQRVYLGAAYYRYQDGQELHNAAAHEPLTNLDLWTLAQTEPDDRRAPAGDFPLSGHAHCGNCGGKMVGSRSGSRAKGNYRRMYKCASKSCARRVSTSAVPLEQLGRELLAEHVDIELRTDDADPNVLAAVEAARGARQAAEAKLRDWRSDEDQAEALGRAAHEAVAATYERELAQAQRAYERTLEDAVSIPLAPGDILEGSDEDLAEAFKRYGHVLRVEAGRGNIAERVTLEPA
jgi:DNA invertase Pin-like site-specific DNA recombinase